jgi:hypothetical protein
MLHQKYLRIALSFALATKVTFINFDLSAENRVSLLLKMISNDFP